MLTRLARSARTLGGPTQLRRAPPLRANAFYKSCLRLLASSAGNGDDKTDSADAARAFSMQDLRALVKDKKLDVKTTGTGRTKSAVAANVLQAVTEGMLAPDQMENLRLTVTPTRIMSLPEMKSLIKEKGLSDVKTGGSRKADVAANVLRALEEGTEPVPEDVLEALRATRALPTSRFQGITWDSRNNNNKQKPWMVRVPHDGNKLKYVGNFASEDEAASAHDAYVRKHGLDRDLLLPDEA